eukprot:571071-Pyramimonas_sp.AAC.1
MKVRFKSGVFNCQSIYLAKKDPKKNKLQRRAKSHAKADVRGEMYPPQEPALTVPDTYKIKEFIAPDAMLTMKFPGEGR